jgi:transcriptional regulator with XRE-family HTH domain
MTLFNNKDRMQEAAPEIGEEFPSSVASDAKAYNSEIEKHVGKKIKLFRNMRGLSQSDVAVKLGITFQQFQKYETGKNRIPISRLMKLASIFGVNMTVFFENTLNVMFDDIMGRKPNRLHEDVAHIEVSTVQRPNSFSVNEFSMDDEVHNLVRYFKSIKDASVRKHISMLVKSLSSEDNKF